MRSEGAAPGPVAPLCGALSLVLGALLGRDLVNHSLEIHSLFGILVQQVLRKVCGTLASQPWTESTPPALTGFIDFSMDGFTLPLYPYGRGDSHENEKQEEQTQGRLNMQYYYVK
ncbi:hypothetical protein MJT46_013958 [Ovis ammon polii x Ovis aries]|nr:hypothetical protein MJT46_013958 [Ovis ammon polii x Ovis aries]